MVFSCCWPWFSSIADGSGNEHLYARAPKLPGAQHGGAQSGGCYDATKSGSPATYEQRFAQSIGLVVTSYSDDGHDNEQTSAFACRLSGSNVFLLLTGHRVCRTTDSAEAKNVMFEFQKGLASRGVETIDVPCLFLKYIKYTECDEWRNGSDIAVLLPKLYKHREVLANVA